MTEGVGDRVTFVIDSGPLMGAYLKIYRSVFELRHSLSSKIGVDGTSEDQEFVLR